MIVDSGRQMMFVVVQSYFGVSYFLLSVLCRSPMRDHVLIIYIMVDVIMFLSFYMAQEKRSGSIQWNMTD